MQKFLLLFSCCFLVFHTAWGQKSRILLSVDSLVVNTALGGKASTGVILTNTSAQAITIKVRKKNNYQSDHQSMFFVLGNQTTPSRLYESVNTYTLAPHHSEEVFTAHFSAGFKYNDATVQYDFVNIYDTKEVTSLKIKYVVAEELSNDLLYVSHDINISHIHPNPILSYGELNYRIASDHSSNAVILIFNILGKPVGRFVLDPKAYRLLLRFDGWKSGVYFYTLAVDGKNMVTKKFVIKH